MGKSPLNLNLQETHKSIPCIYVVSYVWLWNFQEEKRKGKVADFQPSVLMLGLSPSDFVLRALSNVHANDMEQTLLVCQCYPCFSAPK